MILYIERNGKTVFSQGSDLSRNTFPIHEEELLMSIEGQASLIDFDEISVRLFSSRGSKEIPIEGCVIVGGLKKRTVIKFRNSVNFNERGGEYFNLKKDGKRVELRRGGDVAILSFRSY